MHHPDIHESDLASARIVIVSKSQKLRLFADLQCRVTIYGEGKQLHSWNLESEDFRQYGVDGIRAAKISHDDRRVLIASGTELREFDAVTGEELWSFLAPPDYGFLYVCPTVVDYASNGWIAAGFQDGSVRVWNDRRELVSTGKLRERPHFLQFVQDGNSIFVIEPFRSWILETSTGKTLVERSLPARTFAGGYLEKHGVMVVRSLNHIEFWRDGESKPYTSADAAPGYPSLAVSQEFGLAAFSDDNGVSIVEPSGILNRYQLANSGSCICLEFEKGTPRLLCSLNGGQLAVIDPNSNTPAVGFSLAPADAAVNRYRVRPTLRYGGWLQYGAIAGWLVGAGIISAGAFQANIVDAGMAAVTLWYCALLGSPGIFIGMGVSHILYKVTGQELKRKSLEA